MIGQAVVVAVGGGVALPGVVVAVGGTPVLVAVAGAVAVRVAVAVIVAVAVGVGVPQAICGPSSSTLGVVVVEVARPEATMTRPSGRVPWACDRRAMFRKGPLLQ